MAESAHLTSVEALESFRASLIVYLSKARPTLEEVASELQRTRAWLEYDQRTHWEHQWRRRTKDLEQAQQALFGSRLSNLRESTEAEQLAVRRARQALEQTEEKLRRVKRWVREFESRAQPQLKQLDYLLNLLTTDIPKATAFLAQTVQTLSDYADVKPSSGSLPEGTASGSDTAKDQDPASPPAADPSNLSPGGDV